VFGSVLRPNIPREQAADMASMEFQAANATTPPSLSFAHSHAQKKQNARIKFQMVLPIDRVCICGMDWFGWHQRCIKRKG